MSELGVGAVIAGLRIDAVAGRGGMGVVYRATDLELGRPVAVKVIAPELGSDAEFRARFKRESAMAASLDHPHIIPIYHAGETDGQLYLTMRFADGTDLRELIARYGRLEPTLAVTLVNQIASALDAAHARGLVHRDVKPANILIASYTGGPHAYLTDFGLTKESSTSSGMTKSGTVLGTLDYIAPEQLEGARLDGRADIYSLGCVLFYAVTGSVPFPRDSEPAKMYAHLNLPPPRPHQIDPALEMPALETVLQRAMAKKPADRFATAGEFGRSALAAVVAGSDSGPASPPAGTRRPPDAGMRTVVPGEGRRPDEDTAAVGSWPPIASDPESPTAAIPGPRTGSHSIPGPRTGPPPVPGLAAGPHSVPDSPPAAPPRRRGRRGLLVAMAGAAVVVLLAVATSFLLTGRDTGAGTGSAAPSAGPATDDLPAGAIVGSPIPVGPEPRDLAIGAGFVWTANFSADTISKIDPATGTSQEITVGGKPSELKVDGGAVWVWNYIDAVTRVDAATGQVGPPVRAVGGSSISSIAVGGGYLWLSHTTDGTVSRINLQAGRADEAPVRVGAKPLAMAYGLRSLYVVNTGDQTISVLSGTTGQVLGDPVALNRGLGGVEVVDGVIYVGTGGDVTPVDERSLIIGAPIPINGVSRFTVGGGSMWVVLPLENLIRRYDLATREYRAPVTGVGAGAESIEYADGTVWVGDSGRNLVVRVTAAP